MGREIADPVENLSNRQVGQEGDLESAFIRVQRLSGLLLKPSVGFGDPADEHHLPRLWLQFEGCFQGPLHTQLGNQSGGVW